MSCLSSHLTKVQKVCSRSDFPLSAFILLIQGLRNDLNKGLNQNNMEFDRKLGNGGAKEIAAMITQRFNMDGMDPNGQKVGLIDRHHLWSYLCDPFNHEMCATFHLQAGMADLISEMIMAYVPLDEDGTASTQRKVKEDFMV